MQTAFPSPDYYTGSVPSDADSRRRACPPSPWLDGGRATPDGSHVHYLTGRQVRCPAMPLRPRHIYAADLRCGLPTNDMQPVREFPTLMDGCAPLPSPDPPGSSWWADLSGLKTLVPHVHLLVSLAGPTPSDGAGASRRCRGCLPPSPASPRSGCPQLQQAAATAHRKRPLTSSRSESASWRSMSATQRRSGPSTVNRRLTRSSDGVA